jgi:hypothetical protein
MFWRFMDGFEVTLSIQNESSVEFFVEGTCWSETIDGVAVAA